jgi:hypothetical protein
MAVNTVTVQINDMSKGRHVTLQQCLHGASQETALGSKKNS